jgi:hypothetical protein
VCCHPASTHTLNLFLISLPYCNRLARSLFTNKCSRRPVAHRLSSNLILLNHSNSHQIMVSTRSSTRIRQSASPERPSASTAPELHNTKKVDLPPPKPKEERGVRTDIKKPLEGVRLSTFVYILICVLLIFLAWYTYRTAIVAVDAFKVTNASGSANPLWNLVFGECKDGPSRYGLKSWCPRSDIERRIEELADAFGVPPLRFAGAIASGVRRVVPPASLSSLAKEAKMVGDGRIMDILSGGPYEV